MDSKKCRQKVFKKNWPRHKKGKVFKILGLWIIVYCKFGKYAKIAKKRHKTDQNLPKTQKLNFKFQKQYLFNKEIKRILSKSQLFLLSCSCYYFDVLFYDFQAQIWPLQNSKVIKKKIRKMTAKKKYIWQFSRQSTRIRIWC